MNSKPKSTVPKPFVFVLMPFDEKFNDIYKFGIKGAAEDAGAYAERVDEQIFSEGILERIFNQISKADVIVADMTGRNPNVFYEVGYAHALGKIVLLLTQITDDIPFDLKHKQHIIYAGKIETLRKDLTKNFSWAINESRRQGKQNLSNQLLVQILSHQGNPIEIPEASKSLDVPIINKNEFHSDVFYIKITNISTNVIPRINQVSIHNSNGNQSDSYTNGIPPLMPGAKEQIQIFIPHLMIEDTYTLRFQFTDTLYEYPFSFKR